MASARAMRAALQKIAERLSPTELTALLSKLLSEHTSESFRSDVDLALSAIVCAMRSVASRIWTTPRFSRGCRRRRRGRRYR